PFPRGLHQDLSDQFLFAQMVDQNGGSESGDEYEMDVKQIQSDFAQQFDMMRKIRSTGDQQVFQQQQAESDEIQRRQVLELVYEHMENFLRPSEDQRHSKFNAMPSYEHGERKS